MVSLPGLGRLSRDDRLPPQIGPLLSVEEQEHLATFRLDKRRREWLGGRLAGKQALLLLTGADIEPRAVSILPDRHGRPRASLPLPPPTPSLSISHSGGFAVAMACRGRSCGIDIQEIVPRIRRLARHIGDEPELAILAQRTDADETTRLTMLWAAKEAAKKSLLSDRSAFFSAIRLLDIGSDPAGTPVFHLACTPDRDRAIPAEITVHRLADYIMAVTEQDHA